jgi:hypothetical protein
MGFKNLSLVCVLLAVIAVVIQYDVMAWNQTIVAFMHLKFVDMFHICPHSLMNNIMSKLGLSTSEGIGSVGHGYSLGGIPIIRYDRNPIIIEVNAPMIVNNIFFILEIKR